MQAFKTKTRAKQDIQLKGEQWFLIDQMAAHEFSSSCNAFSTVRDRVGMAGNESTALAVLLLSFAVVFL